MSGLILPRRDFIRGATALAAFSALPVWADFGPIPPSSLVPNGRIPGFDPNHMAAAGCVISAVALGTGGAMMAVNTAKAPTFSSTLPTSIETPFGPAMYVASGNLSYNQFAIPTYSVAPTAITYAVIVTPLGGVSFAGLMNNNSYTNSNLGTKFLLNSLTPYIQAGSGSVTAGYTIASQPSFIAVSINQQGSAFAANFVTTNLVTGASRTVHGATTGTIGIPTAGLLSIGTYSSTGSATNGYIHAAMYGVNNYLSLPQMAKWGQDVWGFWLQ